MSRTRMRPAGVAMLLTAMVAVPLTAAAAPYVGPSSLGTPLIHSLPGNEGRIVGIAANGYVATTFSVWPGVGYPIRVPVPTNVGSSFQINDINASGTVVGTLFPLTVSSRGFIWNVGQPSVTEIVANRSEATGIDDSGRVVGRFFDSTGGVCAPGTGFCGYILKPGASLQVIGPTPTGGRFWPQDIGGGLAVGQGWSWDSTAGGTAAWQPIPDPGGGTLALGIAVNEAHQIAGHWIPVAGTTEALFWPAPGAVPTQLGTLAGDTMSNAHGIDENGSVAGWSATASTGARRAWAWAGDGLVELGHVPGGAATSDAFDVQGDLVVGTASGRAVFWDLGGNFDVDYPPEIVVANLTQAAAGELVQVVPSITDFDGDPFTVTCPQLPPGASCDAHGVLTWQTETTDVGTHPWTIVATQDGRPDNTHQVTANIRLVAGVVLNAIGDQQAQVGTELTFTASSQGDGSPSYSYAPSITGASIDAASGVFTWTPDASQVGEHVITVTVSGGQTRTSDSETLTITVTETGGPTDPVTITVSEVVGIGDQVTIGGPVVISVVEAISISDHISVRPPIVISIGETIGVADLVAVRPPIQITVSESVGIGDTVVIEGDAPVVITITETLRVSDSIAMRPPVVISITEGIGVSDGVATTSDDIITAESILDFVATLDDDDFKLGSGSRRALERLITAAGGSLDATDSALARVDGCGDSPDRNDLIVNCDAQHEVRRLLMLLREQMTNED